MVVIEVQIECTEMFENVERGDVQLEREVLEYKVQPHLLQLSKKRKDEKVKVDHYSLKRR